MRKYIKKLNLLNNENSYLDILMDHTNTSFKHFIFYNTHSYVQTLKDRTFMKSVLLSRKVFADGIGVYLASKIFNNKKSVKRVTGYDFFEKLLSKINNNKEEKKIFFLGGEASNLNKLKELICSKYENISSKNIGLYSPPFGENFLYNDQKIINVLNEFSPDIIFVGLGAPKQEKWVYRNYKKLNCKNFLSIGAAFNFFTGLEMRAPLVLRKYGFEWLFRLILNPKKIYKRVFLSGGIFIYLILANLLFNKNYYSLYQKIIRVRLVKDFEKFDWKDGYILSALNLASLSLLYKGDILISKKIFFWGDGIFHRLMITGSKKTAGRELVKIIKYPKEIDTIHVIGNLTDQTKKYLKLNFQNLELRNSNLPYSNIQTIYSYLPNVKKNELILLTLPTPKQEQVAEYLHNIDSKLKIICIGGGLAIAAGDEKEVPKIFDYLGLEWLWRLRYETSRRFKRLLISVFYMLKYLLYGRFNKKIKVKFY